MTFHVIDKRTGKEPIFDGNHIFKEKWCKGRLIEFDIDGWYISEDGTLSLVDDCCNMAYPPPDRYEVVFDEPTVCDIEQISSARYNNGFYDGKKAMEEKLEQIRDEIKDAYDDNRACDQEDVVYGLKVALDIIESHTK